MTDILKLADEFNRYFTSSNGVDVPERVSVSRTEWRNLHAALQARAQVQGEVLAWCTPDGERCVTAKTMAGANKDGGAMLSSLGAFTVPFYTTPQPAQATQAEVTDERILLAVLNAGGKQYGDDGKYVDIELGDLQNAVRAILALRPAAVPMKASGDWFCGNCRTPVPAPTTHLAPGVPYFDATPHLSVGDSAFESWYDQYLLSAPVHQSSKQKARDAYAAGMGDPLVQQHAPGVPDGYVRVPLQVLRDASEALGNFVSDHGWGDSDMQAMDNLDAYIAQHTAAQAQKGQP